MTVPTEPTGHADPAPSDPPSREAIRRRYAALAVGAAGGETCCGPAEQEVFGAGLYPVDELDGLSPTTVDASIGCGNPTAMAELHEGEVVLDLGSGAGIDVILSARRVGSTGMAYGLDMTGEMLDLARRNAEEAGVTNVEFLRGHIEDVPLPDGSVDVVISNCVINLSTDKSSVLGEAARVLRPGGHFAVSDVVADPDLTDADRATVGAWTGCVAGALTRDDYERQLSAAGFGEIDVVETHRVHQHAVAAIIRARKRT